MSWTTAKTTACHFIVIGTLAVAGDSVIPTANALGGQRDPLGGGRRTRGDSSSAEGKDVGAVQRRSGRSSDLGVSTLGLTEKKSSSKGTKNAPLSRWSMSFNCDSTAFI